MVVDNAGIPFAFDAQQYGAVKNLSSIKKKKNPKPRPQKAFPTMSCVKAMSATLPKMKFTMVPKKCIVSVMSVI